MNKDEQMDNEARKKLDDANQAGGEVDDGCSKDIYCYISEDLHGTKNSRYFNHQENLQLKSLLAETQTNIAVLR